MGIRSPQDAPQKLSNQPLDVRGYSFGLFTVDVLRRRLTREGQNVPIPTKTLDTLIVLLERRDRVVEKDELMSLLWPDRIVEEANLTQNVYVLRNILGERPNEHRYVLTIARRGYRFVGDATPLEFIPGDREIRGQSPEAAPSAAYSLSTQIGFGLLFLLVMSVTAFHGPSSSRRADRVTSRAIAVAPFANASGRSDLDYLIEGLRDGITNRLGALPQLTIRARSVVDKSTAGGSDSQSVGRAVGASTILAGRMIATANTLVLQLELIEVGTGSQIWGRRYEREIGELAGLQGIAARDVADALGLTLGTPQQARLGRPGTANESAYEAYLRGCYYWNRGYDSPKNLSTALAYFTRALEHDPNYSLAHVGRATTFGAMAVRKLLSPAVGFGEEKAGALRALALDPDLPEGHYALARVYTRYDWNWPAAGREFELALALNPSYAEARNLYSQYLFALERNEEALLQAQRAVALDPLWAPFRLHLGRVELIVGSTQEALTQLRKAAELEPHSYRAQLSLAQAYAQLGNYPEAVASWKRAEMLAIGTAPIGDLVGYEDDALELQRTFSSHGYAQAMRGLYHNKLRRLTQAASAGYVPPYSVAAVHAKLGNTDQAFEWLQRAYDERANELTRLNIDRDLDSLRPDPRFRALLHRVGLNASNEKVAEREEPRP